MIELQYEMTYAETIAGPLGSTGGSPLGERLCWKVETGRLRGPRIDATLAMPGVDLMRVGPDGLRRPEFEDQYMRMAPQFEVGADRYAWLRESLFVGRGRLTGPRAISYEIYRAL
jgi:hypothetical protein